MSFFTLSKRGLDILTQNKNLRVLKKVKKMWQGSWNCIWVVLSRRSCRVCQFMVFNISDTLLVLWCLLHVYLAARRCTFSSELMFSFVWGSQTVQQYSNLGLIRVWYARSFIVCDCTFRFLLISNNIKIRHN
jgi:hypothetical protein